MTFRTRVLLATAPVVLVPLLVFGFGVRRTVSQRLVGEYQRRVEAMAEVIRQDLSRQDAGLGARLATLRETAAEDDRLRLAVLGVVAERGYLLDYAGRAMRVAGLDLLQLQDDQGRVLSSGHFRNAFDSREPALPVLLGRVGGLALVRARRADDAFLALARLDSLDVAGRRITLVGGIGVDSGVVARLARDSALTVSLVLPEDAERDRSADDIVQAITLPFVDPAAGGLQIARVLVSHSAGPGAALRREVDRWFLIAVLATVLVATLLAGWLSSRAARPLAEVERRAALGDLARQVNHDVKNGLAPLRNVLRHLSEVATREPADLARVYGERRGTLESSLGYLENLAATYGRLYPQGPAGSTDVNAVAREALGRVTAGAVVRAELAENLPPVRVDALALRRVLENLIGNAVESFEAEPGLVTVTTAPADGGVRVTVRDTGPGMTREQLDRAFEDYKSTKPGGTGLGLSIVRRLVLDAGGALRVETEPGRGTAMIVELPGEGTA